MNPLPAKTLTRTITIDAQAEEVWETLTDFSRYAEWNPFVTSARGEPAEGARLTLRIEPPGGKAMTFRPRVLVARSDRELRWLGRLGPPGVFDGEHWFRIDEEGERSVRVTQGEHFRGLLVPLFSGSLDRNTARGFEAMNRALKERVEQSV